MSFPLEKINSLRKAERIDSRKTIDALFLNGKRFSLQPFNVVWLLEPSHTDCKTSVVFSAPKRHFKKAVDRNRIKRLTREAYRKKKALLNQHLLKSRKKLFILFIYNGKEIPEALLVNNTIEGALNKLISLIS